jgi:hypothetical protein
MVESISPEDIAKINAYQRTLSAAVATDKARLLRGNSTERIDHVVLSAKLEDLRREDERLTGLLFAKRAGSGIKSTSADGSENGGSHE